MNTPLDFRPYGPAHEIAEIRERLARIETKLELALERRATFIGFLSLAVSGVTTSVVGLALKHFG